MIENRLRRERRIRLPVALLAAVLLAAIGIGTASALVWQTETAVSDGNIGMDPSLALDSAGHPHVSYTSFDPDDGDNDVSYATDDGTSWSVRARLGDDDGWSCLVLDSYGRPRISHYDVMGFDVVYAAFDGSSWHGGGVIEDDYYLDCKPDSSLALDSADNPRISYAVWDWGSDTDAMKYAAYDGSAWHVETVDPTGGESSSLALDGSGVPRIAYIVKDASGTTALKYAVLDGTTWTIETVDSAPVGGSGFMAPLYQPPSLKLDGAGRPRVAYMEGSTGNARLKYASYDGTSWTIETVDAAGNVGSSPSLALNAAGQPRISYGDWTSGDLKYAWYDGQGWQIDVVDAAGDVGASSSLALDGAGNPRIAYYDATNGDLKYAWGGGPVQAITDLREQVTTLGLPASIQVGLTDKLDAAAAALNRNGKKTAINTLNAFIAQVKAQQGKELTAEQAAALIAAAQKIIAAV